MMGIRSKSRKLEFCVFNHRLIGSRRLGWWYLGIQLKAPVPVRPKPTEFQAQEASEKRVRENSMRF